MLRISVCPYQIVDNLGYKNCLYRGGSVGLCAFDNCPNKVWAIRLVLNYAANGGLRIKLKGLMAKMPLEVIRCKI